MGLFDKILKGAVDAIDNAAAKNGNGPTGLKDLFNQAMDKKNEAINGTSSSTASSKILSHLTTLFHIPGIFSYLFSSPVPFYPQIFFLCNK